MDPSTVQNQGMGAGNASLESILACPKPLPEKKPRPQPEQALNCPRCDSTNTKFCYYNNYSLSQPRYFCKACRRYWTKGGTLRNVPVGGGCRKNKRSSSSSNSSSSSASRRTQDHHLHPFTGAPNSPLSTFSSLTNYDPRPHMDLSYAFARLKQPAPADLDFDPQFPLFSGNPNSTSASAAAQYLPHNQISSSSGFFEFPGGVGGYGTDQGGFGEGMGGAVKQEVCHDGGDAEEGGSMIMGPWGMLPWQNVNLFGGDHGGGGGAGEVEFSGRESWSGGVTTPWHGLINSPLM